MKHTLLLLNLLAVFTIALNAQDNAVVLNDRKSPSFPNSASSEVRNYKEVTGLTLQRFKKEFPTATEASWQPSGKGYLVKFIDKEIQNWAFLDKRGNCKETIRFFTQTNLPADIRKQVRSVYYDFAISSVKEVSCKGSVAYMIIVEDATSWKMLHIMDGEMNVIGEYVKPVSN